MLKSGDGHDGFLLEFEERNRVIPAHLKACCPQIFANEVFDLGDAAFGRLARGEGVGEEW